MFKTSHVSIPHQPVARQGAQLSSAIMLRDADEFFGSGSSYTMPAHGSLSMLLEQSRQKEINQSHKTQTVFTNTAGKFIDDMFKKLAYASILALMLLICPKETQAEARLKDIVEFQGIRDNLLMGYGLVVGLNGTGDKLKNNEFTSQSLIAFLERQGVNTRGTELKSKNVAAVTVTANLPPFSRTGGRINVS